MNTVGKVGGAVLVLAGLLHISSVFFEGWNDLTTQLVPIGLLYMALGLWVVLRGGAARWFAAIASGLGLIAAVQVIPTDLVPPALMHSYIWLDVVVVTCLAVSITLTQNAVD